MAIGSWGHQVSEDQGECERAHQYEIDDYRRLKIETGPHTVPIDDHWVDTYYKWNLEAGIMASNLTRMPHPASKVNRQAEDLFHQACGLAMDHLLAWLRAAIDALVADGRRRKEVEPLVRHFEKFASSYGQHPLWMGSRQGQHHAYHLIHKVLWLQGKNTRKRNQWQHIMADDEGEG